MFYSIYNVFSVIKLFRMVSNNYCLICVPILNFNFILNFNPLPCVCNHPLIFPSNIFLYYLYYRLLNNTYWLFTFSSKHYSCYYRINSFCLNTKPHATFHFINLSTTLHNARNFYFILYKQSLDCLLISINQMVLEIYIQIQKLHSYHTNFFIISTKYKAYSS